MAALLASGCSTGRHAQLAAASPCRDTTVTLYFEPNADHVSDIGRQIIGAEAGRLKGCPVRELSLVGLADPAGAPQANLELSKRRAEGVRDAFIRAGLPVERFTLVARGETGAERPSGVVEPVRRRVDVVVVMGR